MYDERAGRFYVMTSAGLAEALRPPPGYLNTAVVVVDNVRSQENNEMEDELDKPLDPSEQEQEAERRFQEEQGQLRIEALADQQRHEAERPARVETLLVEIRDALRALLKR